MYLFQNYRKTNHNRYPNLLQQENLELKREISQLRNAIEKLIETLNAGNFIPNPTIPTEPTEPTTPTPPVPPTTEETEIKVIEATEDFYTILNLWLLN